jgi:hypothetical protein
MIPYKNDKMKFNSVHDDDFRISINNSDTLHEIWVSS